MEDPLNDAFILFDPKREKMVGRYTMRYNIDPETNKGIIQKQLGGNEKLQCKISREKKNDKKK